jgi:hypothetical protein
MTAETKSQPHFSVDERSELTSPGQTPQLRIDSHHSLIAPGSSSYASRDVRAPRAHTPLICSEFRLNASTHRCCADHLRETIAARWRATDPNDERCHAFCYGMRITLSGQVPRNTESEISSGRVNAGLPGVGANPGVRSLTVSSLPKCCAERVSERTAGGLYRLCGRTRSVGVLQFHPRQIRPRPRLAAIGKVPGDIPTLR